MKRIIYILMFLYPFVGSAQQQWYKSSQLDQMWIFVGIPDFSAGEVNFISLAFNPSGQPYVAFEDMTLEGRDGATVVKFDGSNWVNVGERGFSEDQVGFVSLAISPTDGQPYVGYREYWGNLYKASVMRFDGNNWLNVGNAGFSAGEVWYTCLAFSPSGQPYLAYADFSYSWKATVMKFDGTSWVNVGNTGFSEGEADYISLAFCPTDGQPYVAFADKGNSKKATLMKLNANNWINVGNASFSAGPAYYTSLCFNAEGQPFVAYVDSISGKKSTVKKFDGTNWVTLGNEGFSAGQVWFTSLAMSPSGQPYVAYMDKQYSSGITVMRFDGVNWLYVGEPGFAYSNSNSESLAFNPTTGQPYVAFQSFGANVMEYNYPEGVNKLTELSLLLYPDPVRSQLRIHFNIDRCDSKQIEIFELRGKKVFETKTDKNNFIVNVENFPIGIYIVKVKTESSNWIGKFCKD